MSPTLRQQLARWLADAESDQPRFMTTVSGLCVIADSDELRAIFKAQGLHPSFPFNEGGWPDYREEVMEHRAHLNPARLAWVRKQLESN